MPTATLTETDEMTFCDTCGRELTDAEAEELGDECRGCYDARHFVCARCDDELELDDRSKSSPDHCESCAEAIAEERLDGLKEELQKLVDTILDSDSEVRIGKALEALRALKGRK